MLVDFLNELRGTTAKSIQEILSHSRQLLCLASHKDSKQGETACLQRWQILSMSTSNDIVYLVCKNCNSLFCIVRNTA